MYHPLMGRFLQRDPVEYVDGGNLYQYVRGNPTGFVDPQGTDPQFGDWSGINSNGKNYINQDWKPPFNPSISLSNMSELTTWTTGPWPFAQWNLNREALSAPNPLKSFCPGTVKIEILMIEAATSAGSPVDKCSCCTVHATLLFNPYDNAIGLAGIPNDLADREKQMSGWGEAIPIDIPDSGFAGHTPKSLDPFPIIKRVVNMHPAKGQHPVSYVSTGKSFDARGTDWFKSPQVQGADYAFICHSQGCNMLDDLKKSCNKS